MVTMNISLPDSMKAFVDAQVVEGYSTASEYVRELIRNAQKQLAKEELEQQLLAGLASGEATPMTSEDWDALKRDILAKHSIDT